MRHGRFDLSLQHLGLVVVFGSYVSFIHNFKLITQPVLLSYILSVVDKISAENRDLLNNAADLYSLQRSCPLLIKFDLQNWLNYKFEVLQ